VDWFAPSRYDAQRTTEPNPEFAEEKVKADRQAWLAAYVHVWSNLTKGAFDKAEIEKAADEHWQRSPNSNPAMVAAMEFTKPHKD
jgi:hypothetical protein